MKRVSKMGNRISLGVATIVCSAVPMVTAVAPSFAVTTGAVPPWESDVNSAAPYGSVVFYDSHGNQVTSGTNLNHLFDYAAATTAKDSGATKATLFLAAPNHSLPTINWSTSQQSASTTFPNSSAPSPITGPGFTDPLTTLTSTDADLNAALGLFTLDSTSGYANVIQVRVKDSGAGGAGSGTNYWSTDIGYNNTSSAVTITEPSPGSGTVTVPANSWIQIFPVVNSSTTTLTSTLTSPQPSGTAIPLTAMVTPSSASGTVNFYDNGTFLSNVAVSGGTAPYTDHPAAGPHSYTASFIPGPVPGDETGSNTTAAAVTGGSMSPALAMTIYTPGLLRVTTTPALASQITVDGIISDTWALTWAKEPPGSHTVCFSDVQGYTTPACQTVSVTSGNTTTVNGTFIQRGFLRVTTSPAVPGEITYMPSGTTTPIPMDDWGGWTDLGVGTYTVCFKAVAGFTPPPCQSNVSVTAGNTTNITGTYTATTGAPGQTGVGLLRVTTSPALPSQIIIDDNISDTFGLNWLEIAPGSHTVCFTSVQGYTKPGCQTVTVTTGNTTTVTGTFTQRGFLQVLTSPAVSGTIYINGLPTDDWGFYSDQPPGTYTVCFGAVSGKPTPACQTPTVTPGTTTTITGTY